ncbi:uncharacterized protein [Nicotiana sylvestris]|uniref:Retrotransposon Copia-like N-terminal domain-containing protein n=1 Tax=Nicotiana tabacum TaxID=4097 RepID=A0A1S4BVW2_TOBAC|nr:PREDICTED: uncharacterized protein LOC107812442 [Nicotiana tabacum]
MAENKVVSLDQNHPLFLQAGDTPELVLIPLKLTMPKYYALWSRAMKLALRGKSKLGIVDVSSELMSSIVYSSNAKKVWNDSQERSDRSNLTRIYHMWTAIVTLRKDTNSITSYYSKMKDIWDELDILAPLPSCDCEESRLSVDHLKNIRLLQFLMGLNDSYSNIHNNVLVKRSVVTVNEAYTIISQEESQKTLGVIDSHKDPLTILAGKARRTANVNTTTAKEEREMPAIQSPGQFFTEEKYKQLASLLSKTSAGYCSANMSGIISLLSTAADIYSGSVKGIGKENNRLYLLKENITLAASRFL